MRNRSMDKSVLFLERAILKNSLNMASREERLLVEKVIRKLEAKPLVKVKWDGDVFFVGDLYGDFDTLRKLWKNIPENSLLVFLGNYGNSIWLTWGGVKSGLGGYLKEENSQLKTLLGALIYKYNFPRRVFLLRGCHDTPLANKIYGFVSELRRTFGRAWRNVYEKFILRIYERMPLAVLIEQGDRKIFAVHGGIPVDTTSLKKISLIPLEIEPKNPLTIQLLWNDPSEEVEDYKPSNKVDGSYFFGKKVVERFLEDNDISVIVRAHQHVEKGVKAMFNGKLYTVFSCTLCGAKPIALKVSKEKIEPILLIS